MDYYKFEEEVLEVLERLLRHELSKQGAVGEIERLATEYEP